MLLLLLAVIGTKPVSMPTIESEQRSNDVVPGQLQDEKRRQDSVQTDTASQLEQMQQRQSKINIIVCYHTEPWLAPSEPCASGCVVECWICNREVAGSNLTLGYFAPRFTQPSILPGW